MQLMVGRSRLFAAIPQQLERFKSIQYNKPTRTVSVGRLARQCEPSRCRLLLVRSFASQPPTSSKDEQEKETETTTAEIIRKKLAADVERARELALHQVVNVPNVITFARIVATPYLGYLIYSGSYASAVGVLAAAGLSDWLDGYIARKFKQESIIGSFLDPFADKLMVGTLSLSMLSSGLLPWPLVVLVFGRDFLLVSGTFYHRLKTKAADSAFFDTSDSGAFQVAPTMLSKVNTALQFSTFGLALTNAAWQIPGDLALNTLFGVVGTTTFLSGAEYLRSYINQTGAFRALDKTKKT
ncbi:hypothetical protein Poli38472_012116 [Pythium oligandrum]|uniref:Cardiolipin synthase n=1 Tax=Pythium oligandrum TaxID=41045 RepID=A0A8K1CPA2_PYTOL|nr:hypothetical protein Poli38472_012116 [Pythium oligandrum]|eukprot:TMW67000.1 hypothetical protein Poli38472_012116 [Pythium oligandrum]